MKRTNCTAKVTFIIALQSFVTQEDWITEQNLSNAKYGCSIFPCSSTVNSIGLYIFILLIF